MIRNPKDLVVSFFHFIKDIKNETLYEGSLSDMCDCLEHGEWVYGSWWKHVDQFTRLDNVHIIHYENLLEVQYYLVFHFIINLIIDCLS